MASYEGAGLSTRYYLHADERGSVVAVSDATGAAVATSKYSVDGASASLASEFGFTGQLWLPSVQLYYYKARMYSPQLGRFMQRDPLGYAAGLNLYAYAGGDPVNARDPSGLDDLGLCSASYTQRGVGCTPEPVLTTVDIFGRPWGQATTTPLIAPICLSCSVVNIGNPVVPSLSGTVASGQSNGGQGGGGPTFKNFICSNTTRGVVGGALAGGVYGLVAGKGSLLTGSIGALGGGLAGWATSHRSLTQSQLGVTLFTIGAIASLPSAGGRTGALAGGIGEVANAGVTDFSTPLAQFTAGAILGAGFEAITGGSALRGGAAGMATLLTSKFVDAGFDKMCGAGP